MPKKILYESAVHHFLLAGSRLQHELGAEGARLAAWIRDLRLERAGPAQLRVTWRAPVAGQYTVDFAQAQFYTKGDGTTPIEGDLKGHDAIRDANAVFFDGQFRAVLDEAKYPAGVVPSTERSVEEAFHDHWAATVDPREIDVRRMNEAPTAPEMRYIRRQLGDLRNRTVLDLGCGLGEASVYFALEGADVTATDLSPGMLDVTRRLAEANGVSVRTHLSAAEDLQFRNGETFDIIYAGNILHHVDVTATIDRLCTVLRPGGTFVSWDPVAYNPVINVYRRMATEVRTPGEHPLTKRDLDMLASRFSSSHRRFFWLTTLLIFIWMALVQRRDPNKERYWKKVVDEADRWAPLYKPLALLDRLMLKVIPPLGYLCWNVVFVGRRPRQ